MKNRDAILGKISNIQNCLRTIKKVTSLNAKALDDQFTQDVFVLSLERAAQACIDIANLVIAQNGYELPRSYRHSFDILQTNAIIGPDLCEKMKKMAGFRNIAVHDYTRINLDILKSILTKNLVDFEDYCAEIHKQIQD